MKIIKAAFILLLFMLMGEWTSTLIRNLVPGNVIGMLLLFIALSLHLVKVEDVRPVSDFLIKNMILFFIPASIGLMDQLGVISHFWVGFLVICFVTTLLVVVCVGWLQQLQMRRSKAAKDKTAAPCDNPESNEQKGGQI